MKKYPPIIDRILEIIREHKTFCIVGHMRPDGDCIGSQLGLALALHAEGKKVTVWNQDSIPQKYKFLNTADLFEKPKRGEKFDCVIATDCASFERLGKAGECIGGDDTVKFFAAPRFFKQVGGVEKFVFLRNGILIPHRHFFSLRTQCEREVELRADAVAVRPHVVDDAKRRVFTEDFDDAVNDLRMFFHGASE